MPLSCPSLPGPDAYFRAEPCSPAASFRSTLLAAASCLVGSCLVCRTQLSPPPSLQHAAVVRSIRPALASTSSGAPQRRLFSHHTASQPSALSAQPTPATGRVPGRLPAAAVLSAGLGALVALWLSLRRATPTGASLGPYVCCAAGGEEDTRPAPTAVEDADMEKGVRWDPAMQMWRKDARYESQTRVVPLSGQPYTVWPIMHMRLVEWQLKSVPGTEAVELMKAGAVLLDVRAVKDARRNRPTGSVNVPLFRPVEGTGIWDNVKRLSMALYAMEATEQNPNFVEEVLAAGIKKDDKIIVACPLGGTLETIIQLPGKRPAATAERSFGRETRSLKACYLLIKAGFTNVLHLDGGLNGWYHDGLPVDVLE